MVDLNEALFGLRQLRISQQASYSHIIAYLSSPQSRCTVSVFLLYTGHYHATDIDYIPKPI